MAISRAHIPRVQCSCGDALVCGTEAGLDVQKVNELLIKHGYLYPLSYRGVRDALGHLESAQAEVEVWRKRHPDEVESVYDETDR